MTHTKRDPELKLSSLRWNIVGPEIYMNYIKVAEAFDTYHDLKLQRRAVHGYVPSLMPIVYVSLWLGAYICLVCFVLVLS